MRRATTMCLLMLAATLAIGPSLSTQVQAMEPGVMIFSEDAGSETVPQDHAIMRKIVQALGEELNSHGFVVADGNPARSSGRGGRGDTDIYRLQLARSFRTPPISAVVVFRLHTSATRVVDGQHIVPVVRVPGRVIDTRSGQPIAAFDVAEIRLPRLPVACDRACAIDFLVAQAPMIAREIAPTLVEKLNVLRREPGAPDAAEAPDLYRSTPLAYDRSPRYGFDMADLCQRLPAPLMLTFDGFGRDEIAEIERKLAASPQSCSLRPMRGRSSSAEFWFETLLPLAHVDSSLRHVLDQLGLAGTVANIGDRRILLTRTGRN